MIQSWKMTSGRRYSEGPAGVCTSLLNNDLPRPPAFVQHIYGAKAGAVDFYANKIIASLPSLLCVLSTTISMVSSRKATSSIVSSRLVV